MSLPTTTNTNPNKLPAWASSTWNGGGGAPKSKTPGYVGVGAKATDGMSEETKLALSEVERRDREMDEVELTRIGEGVSELKQIALGMNDALKKQGVGLDRLEEGMNDHKEAVMEANLKLKAANLKAKKNKWGGFGRNLMCLVFLMGQILVLGFMTKYLLSHNK